MSKNFLYLSAIALIVMILLNAFDVCNNMCFSILAVVFTILPAFIAWICERTNIKTFCSEYLSIKRTNWRKSMKYIGLTGLLFPIAIYIFTIILSLFNNSYFGISPAEAYNFFNVTTFDLSHPAELIYALLTTIIFVTVVGSLSGIINTIFEEVAWRGFLNKHLTLKQTARILIITVIWTAWMVAVMPEFPDIAHLILLFVFNLAMSIYLEKVVEQTHSVWTGGMLRGIVDLSIFMPLISIENHVVSKLVATSAVLTIALIAKLLLRKSNDVQLPS